VRSNSRSTRRVLPRSARPTSFSSHFCLLVFRIASVFREQRRDIIVNAFGDLGLERTAQQAHATESLREGYRKTGADGRNLVYGDRKACTEFALNTIELAKRYEHVLTAKRGGKRG